MKSIFVWFGQIFSEPDGNGGKASYGRVFGAIVTIYMLAKDWHDKEIGEAVMTMFMIFVGYSFLSKLLSNNPMLMELMRLRFAKFVQPPPAATADPVKPPQ